jgi:hypothetical protein
LDGETRGLVDAVARVAGRLGEVFEKRAKGIDLPTLWPEIGPEKAAIFAQVDTSAPTNAELPEKSG